MKLDDAIYHAYQAHEGVLDKAGVPYIKHPLRVMRRILEITDEIEQWAPDFNDLLVVAVLHDVWEDTAYILEHLNVAQTHGMAAVTRHFGEFEGETYKEYIARCCQNSIGKIVKYYDLIDNLDPQRMSYLETGEQKGMTKRYEWSLDYIKGLS